MEEIWKDIPGILYGYFQVSNLGRAKRLERKSLRKDWKYNVYKEKIIHLGENKGYYFFSYYINGISGVESVHRAVAKAFIPNPENKPEVNHIDGNKGNNKPENLEWCTRLENMRHASINHLCKPKRGKDHWHAKSVDMLDKNTGEFIKSFDSIADAARYIGDKKFSGKISATARGCQKSSHGYKWRFTNTTVTTIENQ